LAVIEHCRLSSLVDENKTLLQLSEIYHKRWPNCLQIDLWRAKALFDTGKEADAVSLLHNCVSRDPGGVAATRIWGFEHDFSSLWPKQQTIDLTLQIPSNISVALNWNRLGAGAPASHVTKNPPTNRQKGRSAQYSPAGKMTCLPARRLPIAQRCT